MHSMLARDNTGSSSSGGSNWRLFPQEIALSRGLFASLQHAFLYVGAAARSEAIAAALMSYWAYLLIYI